MKQSQLARITIFTVVLALSACSDRPNTTTGALAGGALGAGTGAIIGHQSGHGGEGALIGGAAGALVGAGVGNTLDSTDGVQYPEDEVIRRQHAQMDRQQREILELKRQRYHDDLYRKRIAPVRREVSIPTVALD